MDNTFQKTRGIIESLSDFWLVYFKDLNQLQAMYGGVDILMGQTYLDLLSLLLNNSVQDTPLFNKEYFKLVQIKETEIQFSQRENAAKNCFVYTPLDNIVSIQALQNKVLSVTALLEKDLDFVVTAARTVEFRRDPLNAYRMLTLGTLRSTFFVRNRLTQHQNLQVWLHDTGVHPPELSLLSNGTVLEIRYDGPLHAGRGESRVLVTAINTHPHVREILHAELAVEDAGDVAPPGRTQPAALLKQAVSPLDGYAVRHLQQKFAGKFTCRSIDNWVTQDVEKGDILRLIGGSSIGTPHEFIVALVRPDALYIQPGTASLGIKAGERIVFSILREPTENLIQNEPMAPTGQVVQTGPDGTINVEARTLHSYSAQFSPLYKDDVIEFQGIENAGQFRILEVVDQATVALASTLHATTTAVTWMLYSNIPSDKHFTNGTLHPYDVNTARFVGVGAGFTSQAPGTAIKMVRDGKVIAASISKQLSSDEVLLEGLTVTTVETIAVWGWAAYIPPPTNLSFPQIKSGTVTLSARRLSDHGVLVEGKDYLVNEDQGQIQPLTVWRTDLEGTVSYQYRLVLSGGPKALLSGNAGSLLSSSPARFVDPYVNFHYSHLDQALFIYNVGLFHIKAVNSEHEIELYEDPRLVGKEGTSAQYVWALHPRGTLQTENVEAHIQEIAFWAVNAMVDRKYLYHAFGYLIGREDNSSEAYRALIRGVFQLFMLGPTLERLESAVNTVAGLSVIRDDGEILLDYISGAEFSAEDGYVTGTTQQFISASATFTDAALASYIYIRTGLNENKLFKIVNVLSPHAVSLDAAVTADGPVSWEMVRNPEQQIVTSKRTYRFPKTIPLRTVATDPANIGVKIFRAFEVLTEVFNATDYLETPLWWDRIQIPAELWPDETADRRQSSPQLVEHVINPIDGAKIGDPGLVIGADHTGFSPSKVSGALPMRYNVAFVVLDIWLKHHLFYVSFNPVLMGSLSAELIRDLENLVFIAKPSYTYIILSPASLLTDLIPMKEVIAVSSRRWFGGQRGEEILISTQKPLLIDGTWRIGDWYRTFETQGTLTAPLASTVYPLWQPAPGENARVFFSKVVFDNLNLPRTVRIFRPVDSIRYGDIKDNYLVSSAPEFSDRNALMQIRIQAPAINRGTYTIGSVMDTTHAGLGCEGLVDEENVGWELGATGSQQGLLVAGTFPYAQFTDLDAQHPFEANDVGTLIRYVESQESDNQVMEIVQVFAQAPYTCMVRTAGTVTTMQGPWEHLQEVIKIEGNQVRFNFAGLETPASDISFRAYGLREPLEPEIAYYSPADGDVFYHVDMDHPRQTVSRLRSSLDLSINDDPIRIIRRPVA